MGNKGKTTTVNNIKELNLEIDYDKLAQAIVKAEQNASEERSSQKASPSAGTMIFLTSFIFRGSALAGFWFSLVGVIAIIANAIRMDWNGWQAILTNFSALFSVFAVIVLLLLFSILLWQSAKEIEEEKDRNYVVSVFSGLVGFVALIVALIALAKGI